MDKKDTAILISEDYDPETDTHTVKFSGWAVNAFNAGDYDTPTTRIRVMSQQDYQQQAEKLTEERGCSNGRA